MIGWPIEQGQPQVFSLLNPAYVGVSLSQNAVMSPRKSLAMVIGVGVGLISTGIPCDQCAMRESCHYGNHYVAPLARSAKSRLKVGGLANNDQDSD